MARDIKIDNFSVTFYGANLLQDTKLELSSGNRLVPSLYYFLFNLNLGKDDDLHTTSTVIIMERLQVGDRIYIKMDLDADHGDSKIHSQEKMPSIHFVGQKISD